MFEEKFYVFFLAILVSLFCGFIIGIERERHQAQYDARDHLAFALISTILVILYENFLPQIIIFIIFIGLVIFLAIGSLYRLFKVNVPAYTTTLSMYLSMAMGILSYYFPLLAIAISVLFLIILSTKKQFQKITRLQDIEWAGTVEFIAIVLLLLILIPNNMIFANINLKSVVIIFITILAIKYLSYFLLKASTKNNLYYISFLGGLAHSEATSIDLAKAGASSSSIWLVIQTMLIRMILILLIAPKLLYYALFPILTTTLVGLIGCSLIIRKKEHELKLEGVKNPLSMKSAFIFTGTYLLGLIITVILGFLFLNFYFYSVIAFAVGLLSGGASALFVTTAYISGLVNEAQALIMLTIGLAGAIINKIFYTLHVLNPNKNKKIYTIHLMLYQAITIIILVSTTILTIWIFQLPLF